MYAWSIWSVLVGFSVVDNFVHWAFTLSCLVQYTPHLYVGFSWPCSDCFHHFALFVENFGVAASSEDTKCLWFGLNI